MSSKWKYANIDAEQRLKMLREGNSELFQEEVERTRSITNARREAGLDTTEQENWMDTVGYNYNLWNGKRAGESPDNISKTGYAELYLDGRREERASSFAAKDKAMEKLASARKAANRALEERYASAKAELDEKIEQQYAIFEEAMINSGASLIGGKANRLRDSLISEYSKMYEELEKNKSAELEKLSEKYAGYEKSLDSYAKSGAKAAALYSAANSIINEAAKLDGYDAADVLNKFSSNKNSAYVPDGTTDTKKAASPSENTKSGENQTPVSYAKQLSSLSQDDQKRILKALGYTDEEADRICSYIRSK